MGTFKDTQDIVETSVFWRWSEEYQLALVRYVISEGLR